MTVLDAMKKMVTNPAMDVFLLTIVSYMVYKLVWRRFCKSKSDSLDTALPPLKQQDMTLNQLKQYDGSQSDGRILLAVNGKVFDVTSAKRLYGRDGPYGLFAGRDASRGLATFTINNEAVRETDDDLSDLTDHQMSSVREWAEQFREKYPIVGRLLKPGEEAKRNTGDSNPDLIDNSLY